jgi:hypothetical protein
MSSSTSERVVANLRAQLALLEAKNAALRGADGDGVQGGRKVDGDGVNTGALRCPHCAARLVTKKAALVEKIDFPLAVPAHDEKWSETRYNWWWRLADYNDCDQMAMSYYHDTPHGKQRYAMCPECM